MQPVFDKPQTLGRLTLLASALCWLVAAGLDGSAGALADQKKAARPKAPPLAEAVGLKRLRRELRGLMPTGRGIVTGHVAGGPADKYMPAISPRRGRSRRYVAKSGPSKDSGHARSTASMVYGRGGLASGVTEVHCFSASHWMGAGCLRAGTTGFPSAGAVRVFNHSWIARPKLETAPLVLRRLDYMIDSQDVVVVVGVDNNRDRPPPPFLSGAYNTISVGNWFGRSSGGYTLVEEPGRCKPDLVAPGGTVSSSTPVVTGAVTCLLEVADRMRAEARRAEVVKAVLMAGAEKPPDWARAPGKPLAEHYGAGRLRIDRSYHILRRGPVEPGPVASRYGWSFRTVGFGDKAVWQFDCPAPLGEASVILTWHRRIYGRTERDPFTGEDRHVVGPRMANFDLALVRVDDDGQVETVAVSDGQVDNVEHVYIKQMPAGRYKLEVSRRDMLNEAWDFAVAWRLEEPKASQEPNRPQADTIHLDADGADR